MSAEGHARPTWVQVDLDALRHNAQLLSARFSPTVVCAVVKANAYGHGAVPTATALLEGGAEGLAVALVDEGIELRQGGITAPILLLSEPTKDSMVAVLAAVLTPTLTTIEGVQAAADAAKQIGSKNPVHVKIDTGMNRMGVKPEETQALLDEIAKYDQLILEGIWTHFSVADEEGDESIRFTKQQLELFEDAVRRAKDQGVEPPVLHVANSAGALTYRDARLSMVRVGLALYGLSPNPSVTTLAELEAPLPLEPALSIRSQVIAVRDVEPGARPSYGRKRPMPHAGRVVTIPIGYADGFPRALYAAGQDVLIRGRRFPLAGMVTMDQLVVDVGDAPVEVGDEVVLLGRQGNEEIPVAEWADHLNTIAWEVVCGIGDRVPRRYAGTEVGEAPKAKRRWWRPS
jgi:alanine racemase